MRLITKERKNVIVGVYFNRCCPNYRFYECTLVNEDGVKIEKKVMCKGKLNKYFQSSTYFSSINNEYELVFKKKKKHGKHYI